MKTEEQTQFTDHELSIKEEVTSTFKWFLMGVGGLAVIMSIFIFLPMFFTYLSSGDVRAPSQIHPADPVGKTDHTTYKPIAKNK